eukprot:TRINITY_DN14388_c0_g1_i1.p1 TRINITY_DN14388_c0_g1~~TRINITY_DN14388_c0_g1_i1.p1  ORF type:complete len:305 (-),score=61.42 TRINITY_DN14388_c0_g1_i1:264-1178(-)
MKPKVFHGEASCQWKTGKGDNCPKKAYFSSIAASGAVLVGCGVHYKKGRSGAPLQKRPAQERAEMAAGVAARHQATVDAAAEENRAAGRPGTVRLHRLAMMKSVPFVDGYLKVFPNFKHQSRTDGFGCKSLSPMSLGPVEHGQPGLPASKNLENFHQGSKCFPNEADAAKNPSDVFKSSRLASYNDPIPHRHKTAGGKANKPLFFVWCDRDGTEHKLGYVKSRQFYCTFYERLAATQDFVHLRELLAAGTNLQICGYDAVPINGTVEEAYLDPSAPFGHERVLYAMLTEPEAKWPWRLHKTFDF